MGKSTISTHGVCKQPSIRCSSSIPGLCCSYYKQFLLHLVLQTRTIEENKSSTCYSSWNKPLISRPWHRIGAGFLIMQVIEIRAQRGVGSLWLKPAEMVLKFNITICWYWLIMVVTIAFGLFSEYTYTWYMNYLRWMAQFKKTPNNYLFYPYVHV